MREMVGRKLFKTKICQLYLKGRCHRQSCSFAHGDTDIRRSFSGRRDHEGRDLRETLGRRRSPLHRYSPVKDRRPRHSSHGGYTPGDLSGKNDLKHLKKQVDGEGDSYRSPIDKRQGTSESRDVLDEQLTELQTESDMLLGHKRQLELLLLHPSSSPTLPPLSPVSTIKISAATKRNLHPRPLQCSQQPSKFLRPIFGNLCRSTTESKSIATPFFSLPSQSSRAAITCRPPIQLLPAAAIIIICLAFTLSFTHCLQFLQIITI